MLSTIENFDFSKLSIADRLTLIGRIWDSIDQVDATLTEKQCEQLDRRAAEYEAAGEKGIAWKTLRKRVEEDMSES